MTTPDGWQATTYCAVFTETHERRGDRVDLPVLSVTKTRGPMLASERFGKPLHGRDLAKYRVARRGTFVADPMLLWDGTIGRQEAADCGLVSPDYRVYELAEHVASEFMRYVVRDPRMLRHYQGGARGTNVRRNRIARADFLRIPFALPPLAEQRRIAAILSALDEVIEKTEAVIDSLQTLKKALMQELLTRGLPGRHTRFMETEIGEVPEEWAVVRLAEILAEGPTNGIYKPAGLIGAGSLLLGMTAIEDDHDINWDRSRRAQVTDVELARFGLRRDDILVRRVYAKVDGVGRAVRVPAPPEPAVYESNMMRIRIAAERAIPAFMTACFDLRQLRDQVEGAAQLAAQASVNCQTLRALRFPLPPLAEQHEIMNGLQGLAARLKIERATLADQQHLKAALMSVLLTGELRVTPDEDAA